MMLGTTNIKFLASLLLTIIVSLPVYVSVPFSLRIFLQNQCSRQLFRKKVNFIYKTLVVSPTFHPPPFPQPIACRFAICSASVLPVNRQPKSHNRSLRHHNTTRLQRTYYSTIVWSYLVLPQTFTDHFVPLSTGVLCLWTRSDVASTLCCPCNYHTL